MLLIVMYESGTWRARPGQTVTFGRGEGCSIRLPADDRGVSRSAGSLTFEDGVWWLRNESSSCVLYVSGDRGLRIDLPPGMRAPVQQWHAKIRLPGVLDSYTLRLRLPDLDDVPDQDSGAGQRGPTGEHLLTSTRRRPPLSESDRLILAARFEEYLNWRHVGPAAPRSAKETAERIGWQAHTVAKRCENIRDRYSRLGVPGLRGPRALEELAMLLISTGELTADDLRRLPSHSHPGQPTA
ncbi:MAG TPA: FHA domain-containing protein [Streptosporangiaceae bacterium]